MFKGIYQIVVLSAFLLTTLFALGYQHAVASDVCEDYFSCYNYLQQKESFIPIVNNEIQGQIQAFTFAVSQDCTSANSGCQIGLSDTPEKTEEGSGDSGDSISIPDIHTNPKSG